MKSVLVLCLFVCMASDTIKQGCKYSLNLNSGLFVRSGSSGGGSYWPSTVILAPRGSQCTSISLTRCVFMCVHVRNLSLSLLRSGPWGPLQRRPSPSCTRYQRNEKRQPQNVSPSPYFTAFLIKISSLTFKISTQVSCFGIDTAGTFETCSQKYEFEHFSKLVKPQCTIHQQPKHTC